MALIHDVLLVIGIFAIRKFFRVEIDTLFVTALLTVIGFSVHDTIVVFDRIRENLLKILLKTLLRSPTYQLFNLGTIFKYLTNSGICFCWRFYLEAKPSSGLWWLLLVGIISGTYSSIFNATTLLVLWKRNSATNSLYFFY